VSVAPACATLLLGNTAAFSAQVSGSSNASVSWSVDGVTGGNAAMGTINANGTYQAPAVLPADTQMTIAAASQADPASSGDAGVTVASDVRVQVTPANASVQTGESLQLGASIISAGHPSAAVNWSLSGAGCGAAAGVCGTISSAGLYTAPSTVPQPASVTVTATSVADPSKLASAALQVLAPALAITPTNGTVALEHSAQFSASLGGAATQAVTWSVNGIAGGNTSVGTISNSPSLNGLYVAPVNMPAGRQVAISAASAANPSLSAAVTLQLTSNIVVTINPTSATRIPGARQTFSATVAQTSNPQVAWTVNGVSNGNSTVGQICQTGSNPCLAPPVAGPAGSVDYLAPASAPTPPQVTVKAVSVADPDQYAAAVVTITAQISISVSPQSVTLPPGQTQLFSTTVAGSADQNVSWDVNGAANGSLANGLICLPASNPCQAPNGATSSPVEFRAPATPPNPNTVAVRATSEASPAAQATAQVSISSAPFVTGLIPASVFSGAGAPFGMRVAGVLLAGSQPGPGATIVVNGVARATNCPSNVECDATLEPADVASPGVLTVSVWNPGTPPAVSNTVNLIVVAPQQSGTVVSLDAASPSAAGMDISVVEPTLAGNDPPEELALLEIGLVDAGTGACTLGLPPVQVPRPAAGSATVRLCVFGTSLDQVTQAKFSSPATPDVATSIMDTSQGSVLIEFDVTLSAGTAPGPRTLFVLTGNGDAASLTAALEVQ
jgi:hypothetical protein